MNALVPLPRAATTPAALTRGGKTAKALRLAELNDAEAGDYRLLDRAGYHPAHALAIREARFDRARLIDDVKRGRLWRGLKTDEAREHFYSAPAFLTPLPNIHDDSLIWADGRQIGYLREVPLTLEFYSPREGWYRGHCWGAWTLDSWLGSYPTRADARAALLRHHRDAGKRWAAEHPDHMLVDPDDSDNPPIGRHYARWTGPSAKNKDESLGSAFDRIVAHIQAWRNLTVEEEREHVERFRRDGHLHPRLLRPALIVAKGAAKKWPNASFEDLFAVAAAAMPGVLDEFDPSRYRLATFAQRPVQWAMVKYLTATGILHPRGDANAWLKAQVLRPVGLVAPAAGEGAGDGDDNADNDYSAGEAVLAWKSATFDADALGLTELLAHVEDS